LPRSTVYDSVPLGSRARSTPASSVAPLRRPPPPPPESAPPVAQTVAATTAPCRRLRSSRSTPATAAAAPAPSATANARCSLPAKLLSPPAAPADVREVGPHSRR